MTSRVWGFTGTRKGMTRRQLLGLESILRAGDKVHEGDCIGSDGQCAKLAHEVGCWVVAHPANMPNLRHYVYADEELPEKPPMERNQDIVDAAETLIAAPRTLQEEQRSGTWATIRMARRKGMPVVILEP